MNQFDNNPKKSELAIALTKAQLAVGQLANNKENKHGGYKYVSADSLVGAANKALAENGLAFRCVSSVYSMSGELPVIKFTYKLTHGESGQSEILETECAYVVRNGMPADKAAFVARTTDLSYTLKSLLLIQRGDDADDASARDDAKFVATEPAEPVEVTDLVNKLGAVADKDALTAITVEIKAAGLNKHDKIKKAYVLASARVK